MDMAYFMVQSLNIVRPVLALYHPGDPDISAEILAMKKSLKVSRHGTGKIDLTALSNLCFAIDVVQRSSDISWALESWIPDSATKKNNKDKLFVPISAPTAGIRPEKFSGAKTLQNTHFGTTKL